MTTNTSDEKIGGASNSVSQTRVFSSRKYWFKVEKRKDGFYVLSGLYGRHETADLEVLLRLVELWASPKYSQRLRKRLKFS